MTDQRYFARPARTLFGEIRAYFPMTSQLRVLRVIEHFVALVEEFLRSLPQNGFDANGLAKHRDSAAEAVDGSQLLT